MPLPVTYQEILVTDIRYDHDTRLFPYSPRREIDPELVQRLKTSLSESGFWQPIIVHAQTLDGIAGNHRFLAYIELAEEMGKTLENLTISAMLVDCDEGMAVSIALMENEVREDLTQWEMVRALMKASKRKPKTVEKVFKVDGLTVEQLRLWESELDYEAERQQQRREMQSCLTRDWLQLLNRRLEKYPKLHEKFLAQLQSPSWVRARTLEEFDQAITQALIEQGKAFMPGITWNETPAPLCLNQRWTFAKVMARIARNDPKVALKTDGSSPHFCPYLCLRPEYTPQFSPDRNGQLMLPLLADSRDKDSFPPDALTLDQQHVRASKRLLLDMLHTYCIAPDALSNTGCFNRLEQATAQQMLEELQSQCLPAVLPDYIKNLEKAEQFFWHCPQLNEAPCFPKSCLHAHDTPPGYIVVIHPGGRQEIFCVHEQCGRSTQEALGLLEEKRQKERQQQHQLAIGQLRQMTIEQTLLTSPGVSIDFSKQGLLEKIEKLLLPEWDTPTMFHVFLGWQAAVQFTSNEQDAYPMLTQRPTETTIQEMFGLLRTEAVQKYGLARWVACLVVARSWRDDVNTLEQTLQVTKNMEEERIC